MESRDQQRQSELKRDPRPARRLPAPLFDRLTGKVEPGGEDPKLYRFLEFSGALDSVRREVRKVLNTRTVLQESGSPLTTLAYGLPDFAHVSANSIQERVILALQIARAIEAFEPRLSQVRVNLEPHPSGQRFLVGMITANLTVTTIPEPVSFPLEVDAHVLPVEAITPAPTVVTKAASTAVLDLPVEPIRVPSHALYALADAIQAKPVNAAAAIPAEAEHPAKSPAPR